MPAVLIHGVPDTVLMWDPLRAHLQRDDVIALALPGFGTPVPDGFGATKEEYADWITDQIRALGEPVDLVAHDWGCLLAQRVASTHPELVRTVCGFAPNGFHWCDANTSYDVETALAMAPKFANTGHLQL